jgi:WD40 repeat protein
VHRDIKPGNIMVGPDGSPMLMDFGLAKDFQRDTNQTTEGWIKGTPAYMSPEQASGDTHRIDHRTDIYSLGIVLYELLTGGRAFRGSPQQILDAIRFDEPRNLRSFSGKIPLDLQTICQKAVEKDPARRYQTAGAFADDLRRWLSNEPILARRIGFGGRAVRWCRRNRGVAISGTSIILILIAATTALSLMYVAARDTALREKAALQEANRRLSQLMVVNSKFDTGEDPMAALPWLAEAYRLDQEAEGDEQQKAMSTLRLESAIDAASKLERVWFHDAPITHLAVSADRKRFASASGDGIVRVWDIVDGRLLREFSGAQLAPKAVEFVLDNDHLLVSRHGALQVWEVQSGRKQAELVELPIAEVVVSPSGDRVAIVTGSNRLYLWDWRKPGQDGMQELTADDSSSTFIAIEFQPLGTLLAAAMTDHTVRLWNVASGDGVGQALRQSSLAQAIGFSRDGGLLAVGTADRQLQIWKLPDLDPSKFETLYPAAQALPIPPSQLEFSADGTQLVALATGENEPSVAIWNIYARIVEASRMTHDSRVRLVEYSPDQPHLLSAGNDLRVRIWDTISGRLSGIPLLHGGVVTCARFVDAGHVVTWWWQARTTRRAYTTCKDDRCMPTSVATPVQLPQLTTAPTDNSLRPAARTPRPASGRQRPAVHKPNHSGIPDRSGEFTSRRMVGTSRPPVPTRKCGSGTRERGSWRPNFSTGAGRPISRFPPPAIDSRSHASADWCRFGTLDLNGWTHPFRPLNVRRRCPGSPMTRRVCCYWPSDSTTLCASGTRATCTSSVDLQDTPTSSTPLHSAQTANA